ncbi:MAG: hypothetical protein U1A28_00715, partial [Patescibacteria group bacterium]|nr:hypothetical protein [Patescibacteria group bacterium]
YFGSKLHRYVQLGLLPQSRRTGRGKGKHRGSRGLYPATAIRYLLEIRARLSTGETLAELHRDMQGTIAQDGLGARLARILAGLQQDVTEHSDLDEETRRKHLRELAAIEAKARVLMAQITRIGSTLRQDRRAKDRA